MTFLKRYVWIVTVLFLIFQFTKCEKAAIREKVAPLSNETSAEVLYLHRIGVVEGKTYFCHEEQMNYSQAHKYCQSVDMSLAKVSTEAEETFLKRKWDPKLFTGLFWINLKDGHQNLCSAYWSMENNSEIMVQFCKLSRKVLCERETDCETTTTENPENRCDPEDGRLKGDCISFSRCDESGHYETKECEARGLWEPYESNCVDLLPSGGECVTWNELCQQTKEKYENDEKCLKSRFEVDGECQKTYRFLPPNSTHPSDMTELTCRTDDNVFDRSKGSCSHCSAVCNKDTGTSCCGNNAAVCNSS